jgi:CO dehydrogenase/acetyl-CoA synthase beta subunit
MAEEDGRGGGGREYKAMQPTDITYSKLYYECQDGRLLLR